MDMTWTVGAEESEPPDGTAFLDHIESLLPESGRGPLPGGGEPLPDQPPKNPARIQWSAGSLDGIGAGKDAGDQPLAAAAAILDLLRTTPTAHALRVVADRLAAVSGPKDVDRLIAAVRAARRLDKDRLAQLARWLCVHGTQRGTVKSAIALLGISGTADDQELIVRLGLLEELTLYAVVALKNLPIDAEPAIFDLAQQVLGWGRIQAVRALAGSSNPRVQDWMLRGGAENEIMTEEIAFIAATTGGLRHALAGVVDDDLLDHTGELLRALAAGGPAEDMSHYPDGAAALALYAQHMANAGVNLNRVTHAVFLARYLSESAKENPLIAPEQRDELALRFQALLERPDYADTVRTQLAADDIRSVRRSLHLADRLGIDAKPVAQEWLSKRPHEGYLWQWLVERADADTLPELLDRAVELLPLDALATGPADDLGLGPSYAAEDCLQLIVQRLRAFPGVGWPFIQVALENRVTRSRNGAIRALQSWPRETWPADASAVLTAVMWREPREDVRKNIRSLLAAVGADATSSAPASNEDR